jgi:hypothetical protein
VSQLSRRGFPVPAEPVEVVAHRMKSALLRALVDGLVGLILADLRHAHMLQPLLQLTYIGVPDGLRERLVVRARSSRGDGQIFCQDRRSQHFIEREHVAQLGGGAQRDQQIGEVRKDKAAFIAMAVAQPRRGRGARPDAPLPSDCGIRRNELSHAALGASRFATKMRGGCTLSTLALARPAQ